MNKKEKGGIKMIHLRKELKINAAHHLPGHKKCGKNHGHTFKIVVKAEGNKLKNGMLLDFAFPKIMQYDHNDLNDFFKMPTVENLANKIMEDIPLLDEIEIWESDTSYIKVTRC